jgi:hypothetical protein
MMAILFSSRSLTLQPPYVSDCAGIFVGVWLRDFKMNFEGLRTQMTHLDKLGEPAMCFCEFRDPNGTRDKFMDLKMHFESLET